MATTWDVHKFGGTSVGSADSMRKCIDIIRPRCDQNRVAMVVSAMGGKPKVTDLLLDSVRAAANDNMEEARNKLDNIRTKHQVCIEDLLNLNIDMDLKVEAEGVLALIEKDLRDIMDLLRAVTLMRTPHEQILELVSGYGEIWSATLLSVALRNAGLPFVFLNARDVLFVTEDDHIGTKVHWEVSEEKLSQKLKEIEANWKGPAIVNGVKAPHLIITGYIASTPEGVATTLKRDGSDFSGAIFGKLLKSMGITIWTDVSGVYSADPRRVPGAIIIPEVSYTEAIELAYFGAKVIHPKTMSPAIMSQIPIYIRNTFEPEHPGTRIFVADQKGAVATEKCVCGFSTVDDISLLNLEGAGMIGVPGIAQRLFGALNTANISVSFIAQASSEHSICFATKRSMAQQAKQAVEESFFYELKSGMINAVQIIDNCSMIAAVGEHMSNASGVSGIFFDALGKARINVLAISQGCDERNISAVVHADESGRALKAVHAAFWLSSQVLTIGIVGSTGKVGNCLLQTILDTREMLKERFDIDIQVRGVMSSRKMLLAENLNTTLKETLLAIDASASSAGGASPYGTLKKSLSSGNLLSDLDNNGEGSATSRTSSTTSLRRIDSKLSLEQQVLFEDNTDKPIDADMQKFFDHIVKSPSPHLIMIDTTDSETVANWHPKWLRGGAHVITSSKRALSSSLNLYNEIIDACRANTRTYMSEVTIGASVPVLTTLTDMLHTGDAIHKITGLMSVSASQIMTMCDAGKSFSEAIGLTYEQELFELDPFIDLEGHESAQKLLILARTLGYPLNLEDIEVEPLASRRDVKNFLSCAEEFKVEDALYAEKVKAAKAKGCTLRYIQRLECSPSIEIGVTAYADISMKATIRLEEVKIDDPIAQVKGAVYHFQFYTDRYAESPLIIQGPLSDALNTASGIIGDLLRIARSLGASDRGRNIPLASPRPENIEPPNGIPRINLNKKRDAPLNFY